MKWKPFVSGAPYTCQECPLYAELKADRDRLQVLVSLFDELYVCPECEKYAATYMMDCQNPLHKIHLEAWDSGAAQGWSVRVCDNPEAVRGE